MSKDVRSQHGEIGGAALFALIVVLIAFDMWVDLGEGATLSHMAAEALTLTAAMFGFITMFLRYQRMKRELAAARAEAVRWKAENTAFVAGIGAAIDQAFRKWELTAAEADVGLLLLKGLSLQEIADLRHTSERTVREQARTVYRKGGLSSRNELAAFFLEDLLPPAPDG